MGIVFSKWSRFNRRPSRSDFMSNNQARRPETPVKHIVQLSEDIGALLRSHEYSDITFLVENTRFPAHKVILAARNEYFRALLFGGMRESSPDCSEIRLGDTTAAAFQTLLKYVYSGWLNFNELKDDSILDVLGLAHRYGFQDLETAISDYLRDTLVINNVCLVYNAASLYGLSQLIKTSFTFMDSNASDIMKTEAFMTLSESALYEVIRRDSFYACETEIFEAVQQWSQVNKEANYRDIVKAIRLPLMNIHQLLNLVRPTNLITPNDLLDAIQIREERSDGELNHRGFLFPEEDNVAALHQGSKVICGEMKAYLLDGDTANYDMDRGFTRHAIEELGTDSGIVVQLGRSAIINHIRLLLWDRDLRSYCYYIEVSMNQKDWVRVIDYSKYICRSWQLLYFEPRVIRYIRITGVHNTVNKVFHLVSLECFYSNRAVTYENGIIIPSENVATIDHSAVVIEGVSRSRNALLNGDTKDYDWDSGYTCHQLGSGSIVVQLAQPYLLGSMRLLLWDCDDRAYGYKIEVSTDNHHWILVCDRSNVPCKSWQTITFEKQPITFIKIVGINNTANEVFHCVHFECPAQVELEEMVTADEDSLPGTEGEAPPSNGLPPNPSQVLSLQDRLDHTHLTD